MSRPIDQFTTETINNLLREKGYTWQELADYCASFATPALSQPTPAPKSEVDAKFVEQAVRNIMAVYNAGDCKLSRSSKEFLLSLRERAGQYKSVRFSPKQWSWFNSIMVDAGVEALEQEVTS
jgi:hypothetical protein